MEKKKIIGLSLTGVFVTSLIVGIPLYLNRFQNSKDEDSYAFLPQIRIEEVVPKYLWQEFTVWANLSANTSQIEYDLYLNDQQLYSGKCANNSNINYTFNPLNPSRYNFTIIAEDENNLTKSESIIILILDDSDFDGDNLYDHQESLQFHTDPTKNDTDSDGLRDDLELFTYKSNPNSNDSDSDHLLDYLEIFTYHTNPISNDSDSDGLQDYEEIFTLFTNATSNDTDGDLVDDFSEIYLFLKNPLIKDTIPRIWEGGAVNISFHYKEGMPQYFPSYHTFTKDVYAVPRTFYRFLCNLIQNGTSYIESLIRAGPIKIMIIDNFNSGDIEERVHGSTCVSICDETISATVGSTNNTKFFSIIKYSVSELDRSWKTAINYAIAQGVDVISLSQVSYYGSTLYFDLIQECIEKYDISFCSGTGNDNQGDPTQILSNSIRYPALHPSTIVIGGVVSTDGHWKRWDNGIEGSTWGRSSMVYNDTTYNCSVDLVANCQRRILFTTYFGVSWAIPQVAAVCGLLLNANPYLTPLEIRQILINSTNQINPDQYSYDQNPFVNSQPNWDPEVGYGMLNPAEAIKLAVDFTN